MLNSEHIFPSLLAANPLFLGDILQTLLEHGIQTIHVDIMDNHYVPNLTFGPHIVQHIHEHFPTLHIDVHLMITPVDAMIETFAKAGAHAISIHPHATYHIDRSLRLIRTHGCRAGLTLDPGRTLHGLAHLKHLLDFILIMGVNPGFGGQSFIPETIQTIQDVRREYPTLPIHVDGGVDHIQLPHLQNAGATHFIVGSALFNTPHYIQTLHELCA